MVIYNKCIYSNSKLITNNNFVYGRYYEWIDKFSNKEIARMKEDAYDHFYPATKNIKEENVIGWKEISPVYTEK